jgi:hypothetical protein
MRTRLLTCLELQRLLPTVKWDSLGLMNFRRLGWENTNLKLWLSVVLFLLLILGLVEVRMPLTLFFQDFQTAILMLKHTQ